MSFLAIWSKGFRAYPDKCSVFVVHKCVACCSVPNPSKSHDHMSSKIIVCVKIWDFLSSALDHVWRELQACPLLLVSTRDALSRALASIAFVHTKRKMSARQNTSCIETRCQKSVMVMSNWRCPSFTASSGNCADISKLLGRDPKTPNEKITTFL